MFTNFLDQPSNGIEVRIGLCRAIEANRKKIFPCTEAKADQEKALHHSLIYGLLKLIIDDDYDVRKLIGNILPQQVMFQLIYAIDLAVILISFTESSFTNV